MKNMLIEEIKRLKDKKSQTVPDKIDRYQPSPAKQRVEKSNSNTHSQKTTTHTLPGPTDLFKGMSFCFPIIDIDLSPKRVEFMTKSILQQGGTVIQFKDQNIEKPIDYLLVNPKAPIQQILKQIGKKIQFKQILDYNFVNHCLREAILLAISNYSLYKNRQQEDDPNEDERTLTIAKQPQKLLKTETLHANLYRPKIQEDIDTDSGEFQQQTKTIIHKAKTEQVIFTQPEEFISDHSNSRPLRSGKKPLNRSAFLCQRPKQLGPQQFSVNKFICDELMKLQRIYQNQKDVGRKIAYLKAVSAIKTLDKEIETEKDLQNLRGVGSKIIKKVKELLQTGKLQKLERLQQNTKRMALEQLSKIWGVGPNKAEELYSQGITSVQQLKTRTDTLNKNQRIGLKYYDDFQKKIPRQKIERVFEAIKALFSTLVDNTNLYHLEVCGSYRRGKPLCGDIDILISRKDGKYQKTLLLNLILELEKEGIITEHLVFPSSSLDKSSLSYMGVCHFPEDQGDQTHHRIDIKYYPISQYPYALLYFTGSDMFNRSMRLYASKLGIQLNDHGAVAKRRNPTDQFWDKPIPVCHREEEIFQFLGMEYKTPQERNV